MSQSQVYKDEQLIQSGVINNAEAGTIDASPVALNLTARFSPASGTVAINHRLGQTPSPSSSAKRFSDHSPVATSHISAESDAVSHEGSVTPLSSASVVGGHHVHQQRLPPPRLSSSSPKHHNDAEDQRQLDTHHASSSCSNDSSTDPMASILDGEPHQQDQINPFLSGNLTHHHHQHQQQQQQPLPTDHTTNVTSAPLWQTPTCLGNVFLGGLLPPQPSMSVPGSTMAMWSEYLQSLPAFNPFNLTSMAGMADACVSAAVTTSNITTNCDVHHHQSTTPTAVRDRQPPAQQHSQQHQPTITQRTGRSRVGQAGSTRGRGSKRGCKDNAKREQTGQNTTVNAAGREHQTNVAASRRSRKTTSSRNSSDDFLPGSDYCVEPNSKNQLAHSLPAVAAAAASNAGHHHHHHHHVPEFSYNTLAALAAAATTNRTFEAANTAQSSGGHASSNAVNGLDNAASSFLGALPSFLSSSSNSFERTLFEQFPCMLAQVSEAAINNGMYGLGAGFPFPLTPSELTEISPVLDSLLKQQTGDARTNRGANNDDHRSQNTASVSVAPSRSANQPLLASVLDWSSNSHVGSVQVEAACLDIESCGSSSKRVGKLVEDVVEKLRRNQPGNQCSDSGDINVPHPQTIPQSRADQYTIRDLLQKRDNQQQDVVHSSSIINPQLRTCAAATNDLIDHLFSTPPLVAALTRCMSAVTNNNNNNNNNTGGVQTPLARAFADRSISPRRTSCSTDERDSADGIADNCQVSAGKRRRKPEEPDEALIRIPLAHGWERKTHVRLITRTGVRGDVVYFAPDGRKLKSFQEIDRYLLRCESNGLSRQNFTFSSKLIVGTFVQHCRDENDNIVSQDLTEVQILHMIHQVNPEFQKRPMELTPGSRKTQTHQSWSDVTEQQRKASRGRKRPPSQVVTPQTTQPPSEPIAQPLPEHAASVGLKPVTDDICSQQHRTVECLPAQALDCRCIEAMSWNADNHVQTAHEQDNTQLHEHQLCKSPASRTDDENQKKENDESVQRDIAEATANAQIRKQRMIDGAVCKELKSTTEDLIIKDTKPLPSLDPVEGLRVSQHAFSDCLQIVEFLSSFAITMKIRPAEIPTLAELQDSLVTHQPDNMEESCFHKLCIFLLKTALSDAGLPHGRKPLIVLGQPASDFELTPLSVSEILKLYIDDRADNNAVGKALTTTPIYGLSPYLKASALAFLCEELMSSKLITECVDANLSQMVLLRHRKWQLEGSIRRLRSSIKHNESQVAKEASDIETLNSTTSVVGTATSSSFAAKEPACGPSALSITSKSAVDAEQMDGSAAASDLSDADDSDSDENESTVEHQTAIARFTRSGKFNAAATHTPADDTTSIDDSVCGETAEIYQPSRKIDSPDHPEDNAQHNLTELTSECNLIKVTMAQRSQLMRTCQLGQDRYYRRYWLLTRQRAIYVEGGRDGRATDDLGRQLEAETLIPVDDDEDIENDSDNHTEVGSSCCEGIVDDSAGGCARIPHFISRQIESIFAVRQSNENDDSATVVDLSLPTRTRSWTDCLSVLQKRKGCHCDSTGASVDGSDCSTLGHVLPGEGHEGSGVVSAMETDEFDEQEAASIARKSLEFDKPCQIPEEYRQGWWIIKDKITLRNLLQGLLKRGIRERNLMKSITRQIDHIDQILGKYEQASGRPEKPDTVNKLEEAQQQRTPIQSESEDTNGERNSDAVKWECGTSVDLEIKDEVDMEMNEDGKLCQPNDNINSLKTVSVLEHPGKSHPSLLPRHSATYVAVRTVCSQLHSLEERILAASLQVNGCGAGNQPTFELLSQVNIDMGACLDVIKTAIIDLEAMIERRYLKPPFVKRIEACLLNNSSSDEEETLCMGRWKLAVQQATSSSRLSICLTQLEKHIAWEKSIMRVICQICNKDENEDTLLLCDGCDRGHHTYCFVPQITEIPDGDWFCFVCLSKVRHESLCFICGKPSATEAKNDLLACEKCQKNFHGQCHKGAHILRSRATCIACSVNAKPSKARSHNSANAETAKTGNSKSNRRRKSVSPTHGLHRKVPRRMSSVTRTDKPGDVPCRADSISPHSHLPTKRRKTTASSVIGLSHIYPDTAEFQRKCREMVAELIKYESSWPFLHPVDSKEYPEYYKIIKNPIDLQAIKRKAKNNQYANKDEFASDVLQLFYNCHFYNEDNSSVGKAGIVMKAFFEKRFNEAFCSSTTTTATATTTTTTTTTTTADNNC